jgi:hypothetical protein
LKWTEIENEKKHEMNRERFTKRKRMRERFEMDRGRHESQNIFQTSCANSSKLLATGDGSGERKIRTC